ncbi:MAG: PDZ domain-containing protein [Acidimicrobiales bacterium]
MVAVGAAVVVALAGTQAFLHFNPYYSLAPGTALEVGQLITVPSGLAHPGRKDAIFLTDVLVTKVGVFNLVDDLFKANVALTPAVEITGGAPSNQVNQQNLLEMSDSKRNAEVAALRRLGYNVPEHNDGAVVVQVSPHSAAAAANILVGDNITALDGVGTPTAAALVSAVHAHHPGDTVGLTVSQGVGKAPVTDKVTLGARLDPTTAKEVAYLGIATGTLQSFNLPVSIKVNSLGIGGPSAGLAFTLGIIDQLAPGSLTGGLKVAATGTIDPLGNVGDVGGVAQKTIAVRNAGATVFLVPPQEYKVALDHAGQHLKVFAVSSLNQALDILHRLGGSALPSVPTATAAGSSPPGA